MSERRYRPLFSFSFSFIELWQFSVSGDSHRVWIEFPCFALVSTLYFEFKIWSSKACFGVSWMIYLFVVMMRSCPWKLEFDLLLLLDYVFRGPIQDAAARYECYFNMSRCWVFQYLCSSVSHEKLVQGFMFPSGFTFFNAISFCFNYQMRNSHFATSPLQEEIGKYLFVRLLFRD